MKDVYVGGVLFGLEIVDMKGKFTIYAYIAKGRKSINGSFPDTISYLRYLILEEQSSNQNKVML